MWEKLWKFLSTPPNKLEIPFIDAGIEALNDTLAGWLSKQILEVTQWLATLLLYTPTVFLESDAFQKVHGFVSSIAFGLMIPTLMWVGFRHIQGTQDIEESMRQAVRFLLVPLGVRLLPLLVLMSLRVFNTLTYSVLMTAPMAPEQVLNPGVFSVSLLLFLALYVWLAIQLIRYYCYRNFALVVLVVFSPILLLTWAVDGGTRLQKWRDELIGLMLTQVVHALELVVLVVMTVGAGSISENGIPVIALQVGALTFMTKTPEWLQGYIQSVPEWFPLRQPRLPRVSWMDVLRRARGVFKP